MVTPIQTVLPVWVGYPTPVFAERRTCSMVVGSWATVLPSPVAEAESAASLLHHSSVVRVASLRVKAQGLGKWLRTAGSCKKAGCRNCNRKVSTAGKNRMAVRSLSRRVQI